MSRKTRYLFSVVAVIVMILAIPITPIAANNRLFNFDKSEITKVRLDDGDGGRVEETEDPEKIAEIIDILNNFEYTASHPRDPDLMGCGYGIALYSNSFGEDGVIGYGFGPDSILADGVWYISEEESLQLLVESIRPGGEYWVYVRGAEWTLGLAQKAVLTMLYGE